MPPEEASQSRGQPAADAPPQVDPYADWLGLSTRERPPSAYALLGMPELEHHPKAIGEASRQAKRTVRAYQVGPYRQQALDLLREIGQAVETLTNPEKKAAYDARRHRQLLELAQVAFPQAELERPLDEIFAEWLTRCEQSGYPVARLLPELMQWCLGRSFKWPARGRHEVPLPLGLWIYFEAAVVGQCVARSPLEQRVRAVKRAQGAFGITPELSRIIIVDVARRPESFAETPLVRTASERPRELMQEWINRLAGCGVVLEESSATYAALAFLLGLADEQGRPIDEPVRPNVVEAERVGPVDAAVEVSREAAEHVAEWSRMHRDLVRAVLIALAISVGLVGLLLVLLIVAALGGG